MDGYDLSLKGDSFQDDVFFLTSFFFLFFIFIYTNSGGKNCSYHKMNGCKNFTIAVSSISLNLLQVICQNPCSDLSSKIIFNSLSTESLVISSFNLVESRELESTWPMKWFFIQLWKSFTFLVSGKYTKKVFLSLNNESWFFKQWHLVWPSILRKVCKYKNVVIFIHFGNTLIFYKIILSYPVL